MIAAAGTREALQVVFGPVVLAVFGVSLAASGVFSMDAMRGYPPGTAPGTPSVLSRQHKVHDVFGFLVFSSLPVACVAFAVALPEGMWVAYSLATAVVLVVLFITFGAAWERDAPRTGLIQRAMIIVGWTWIALVCLELIGLG